MGSLVEEKFYQFDAAQKLLKDSTAINGKVNARTVYAYNSNGFLSKKTLLGSSFQIEYEIDYLVDEQGRNTEEKFTYKGEMLNRKVYTYNGNLLSKEEQFNNIGDLVRTRTWDYNCN